MHVFDNKNDFKRTYDALLMFIAQQSHDVERIIASCTTREQLDATTSFIDTLIANWVNVANRICERHERAMRRATDDLTQYVEEIKQRIVASIEQQLAYVELNETNDVDDDTFHAMTEREASQRYARSQFVVRGFYDPSQQKTKSKRKRKTTKNE